MNIESQFAELLVGAKRLRLEEGFCQDRSLIQCGCLRLLPAFLIRHSFAVPPSPIAVHGEYPWRRRAFVHRRSLPLAQVALPAAGSASIAPPGKGFGRGWPIKYETGGWGFFLAPVGCVMGLVVKGYAPSQRTSPVFSCLLCSNKKAPQFQAVLFEGGGDIVVSFPDRSYLYKPFLYRYQSPFAQKWLPLRGNSSRMFHSE